MYLNQLEKEKNRIIIWEKIDDLKKKKKISTGIKYD